MRQTAEGVVLLQEHEARTRLFDTAARGALGDERTDTQVDGGAAVRDIEFDAVVGVVFANVNATENLRLVGARQSVHRRVGRISRGAGVTEGKEGGGGGIVGATVRLHDGPGEVVGHTPAEVTGHLVVEGGQSTIARHGDGVDLGPSGVATRVGEVGLQLRAAGDRDVAANDTGRTTEAERKHAGADGGVAGVGLGVGVEHQRTRARLREASCARQHGLHRGGLTCGDGDRRGRAREREGLRGERHPRLIVDAVERRGRTERDRLHRTAGEVGDVGVGEGVGRGGRGAWDRRPGAGIHPERAVERGRARGAGAGGRAVLVEEDVGGAHTRRRTYGEESGGGEKARAGDELRGATAFHLSKVWG